MLHELHDIQDIVLFTAEKSDFLAGILKCVQPSKEEETANSARRFSAVLTDYLLEDSPLPLAVRQTAVNIFLQKLQLACVACGQLINLELSDKSKVVLRRRKAEIEKLYPNVEGAIENIRKIGQQLQHKVDAALNVPKPKM